MPQIKEVMYSGIQPSGDIHLGQYFAAIRHWLEYQGQYQCLFCIVDLHTLTVRQDPKVLPERCYDVLAMYLACGLDYKQHILYLQSHVAEHTELAWLLNCFAMVGELNRMTQFKDKAKQHAHNVNAGLLCYPALMAADILLYQTRCVPVGDDQVQHLELARDLAQRFNHCVGSKVFQEPKALLNKRISRVMGLQDPSRKMSKSDENQNNVIKVLDPADVIRRKISRAVTDNERSISYTETRPGLANLMRLYAEANKINVEEVEQKFVGKGYKEFKGDLAESIVALLAPVVQEYQQYRADRGELDRILQEGSGKAKALAAETMRKVRSALGLIT
jgi:tryptophanyl-tRNA synthetase